MTIFGFFLFIGGRVNMFDSAIGRKVWRRICGGLDAMAIQLVDAETAKEAYREIGSKRSTITTSFTPI